ncbi:TPA: hypothetical protein ACJTOK_003256 [Klebsiella aerogenes]|nr:hypothetical protein [Klebsiella aerogenes]HBT3003674.1 hypothetical protein [Klebsiella aerogenes]HCR0139682.1 hypothetical protein [Klebsiella aerogenes]HDT1380197.1 hypothetical protein [Klebsiella aerogenes]HDU5290658.1 hypothetical protein [Klebsiella aerogenes]
MRSFYVLILTLVASFVSAPVQAATDNNYEKGTKAQQKSISYLSCAFYGSSTQLDPNYTGQVPTADIKILQKAAYHAYNDALSYLGYEEPDREQRIIDYAEFVASQEAVLWGKPGMNGKQVTVVARSLYNESNCDLLLDSIK